MPQRSKGQPLRRTKSGSDPTKALTAEHKRKISELFDEEKPDFNDLTKWGRKVADKLETHASCVIALATDLYEDAEIRAFVNDVAARNGNNETMRANLYKALTRCREALEAEEREIRVGPNGSIVINEFNPDHPTRMKAVYQFSQMMSANLPQTTTVVHDISERAAALSQAQLELKIAKLIAEHPELREVARSQITGGVPDSGGGTPGEEGTGRSLVLVDGVYQDEGRTGP